MIANDRKAPATGTNPRPDRPSQTQPAGDVNRVSLVGTVADEPRLFGDARPVLKMRVTTSENVGGRSYPNTHSVVVFGDQAASLSLATGDRVAIEGRLQNGSYINKAGAKVYTVEVVATKVDVLAAPRTAPLFASNGRCDADDADSY